MNNRPLHRLESYQSGGSIHLGRDDDIDGDGEHIAAVNAVEDDNDIDAPSTILSASGRPPSTSRSGGSVMPHLFAQFSLIGDDSSDDDDGMGNIHYLLPDAIQRRCRKFSRAILVLGVAVVLALATFLLMGLSRTNSSSVATNHNGTISSTESSEQSEYKKYKSCPIQSSYSVSSDLMGLKNSSTVENMKHGAVASDQPVCSQVGISILKDLDGNAADAAIATALCLGVVNPTSSGIGGGAFILVHSTSTKATTTAAAAREGEGEEGHWQSTTPFIDARTNATKYDNDSTTLGGNENKKKKKVTEFIDCRETAPQNATVDMFESNPESSMLGGLAIAIPGELRGLELLHQRHGSLSWDKLVRPSVNLARKGFVVGTYLANEIKSKEQTIRQMPNLMYMLTKDNDGVTLLKEGDVMKRPQYAKTLEAIMMGGADALYQGDMSKMLAKDIQDAGGIIVPTDISDYRPVLRDPLISKVAGYNVVGSPPPSSGGSTIIGAIRFLAGFTTPYSALLDTLSKHWYVEACRHVFAIRMSLSDPDFNPEDNANAVKDLIEGEYIESLRKMTIDDSVLKLSQYGGPTWAQLNDADDKGTLEDAQEGDRRRMMESVSRNLRLFNYLDDHGTSSFSVVDKDRNTVTMTSSVNLAFGSKVVSPSTGIVLNNQMDDFSSPGRVNYFGLHPSESNYVVAGKRPLSSMSPMFVFRDNQQKSSTDPNDLGTLILSIGASGGPKIITSVLQTILNKLFVGMPLYESISQPRIHNQLLYHGAAGTNIEHDTLPQGPSLRLSNRTVTALKKRGHKVVRTDFLGTVQAVAVDLETNTLSAVSDVRKQGMPAGY